MIKIMIVDDMPIFLEYLRGCIDWRSYGFEICCEAHDGREAMEKIEEYYPDVVLTDITMPYVDGLELADHIAKNYPDISVILITGNNEFEYARKAVKIGVCDYIVKPFEKEELIMSLLKLADNIEKAVENQTDPNNDESEERTEVLRSLIYASESINTSEIREKLGVGSDCFLLSVFRVRPDNEVSRETLMNWQHLIRKMLSDKIEITGKVMSFHDYENNVVTLMEFTNSQDRDDYKGYEFADLIQIVKNQIGIESIATLSQADEIGDLHRVYANMIRKIAGMNSGQVVDLRKPDVEGNDGSVDIPAFSMEAIYRLNKDLDALKTEDVIQTLNGMWEMIKENGGSSKIGAMHILSGAVSVLMTNIINAGLSIDAIYGANFSPERALMGLEDQEAMKDTVIDLYVKRIEYEKNKHGHQDKAADIARSVAEYINEHYSDQELSVPELSARFLVNQTYLRKMFKSENLMTISEYLTQVRMQQARKLITETDQKLAEVAEAVGYSDVSYFSNVFKKYYGVSPRSLKA